MDRGRDVQSPPAQGGAAFLADAMLARLARWLRTLGCDTLLEPQRPDRELVAIAACEDRVLLTRDRHLVAFLRPAKVFIPASDVPLEQLAEVVAHCALPAPTELFTRCLVCNAPLRAATAEEAAAHVPPTVQGSPDPVRRCPGCGRVYWQGSHTRRMREALWRALPEWAP
ncbi:Mut7-C RNAse domain-containing protein [Coralloluteibacterium stylophorae]|uniref:Mut7-C RNAse domain-containing protein n=1 Tax=Coralloluteibacterium stylophorae TaxID=1776034 RepID=A0A8J7VVH7_9GAMM|nr:Mut7-C RNAse domain-containing protein [Coralloluteibacterium stylophorae]